MRKTIRRTKRKEQVVVKVYAPEEIGAEILEGIVKALIEKNRRREKAGGERVGYRVELMSSSSRGECIGEACERQRCVKTASGVYEIREQKGAE